MGLVSSCVPTLRLRPDYAGEIEKPTISNHFGFAIEISGMEITWLSYPCRFRKASFSKSLWLEECFWKAPFSWRISVDGRPNRRNKASFTWRISVDGRPNRRNKALFSWRISVDGRPNRGNKAAFSWRISVDGRPNRWNKAPLSWRISVDGRPNRWNKAAFSKFSCVVYMVANISG